MNQPCRRQLTAIRRQRGGILVVAMVLLLVMALLGAELVRTVAMAHRVSEKYRDQTQALWLAESGIDRAIAQLAADEGYKGETWRPSLSANEAGKNVAGSNPDLDEPESQDPIAVAEVIISIVDEGGRRLIRVAAACPNGKQDPVVVERVHKLRIPKQDSSDE